MTTLRNEAQNPETSAERLHELINLPGDRADGDQDAGWCREDVAANPSASPQTLRELAADQDDTMARFNAARNPSTDAATLQLLAGDRLDYIANAARERLGLPLRPQPGIRVQGVPRFDPRTGRMTPVTAHGRRSGTASGLRVDTMMRNIRNHGPGPVQNQCTDSMIQIRLGGD